MARKAKKSKKKAKAKKVAKRANRKAKHATARKVVQKPGKAIATKTKERKKVVSKAKAHTPGKQYTHDELTEGVKSRGWALITGRKDKSITDTLENLLHLSHKRHKKGQAPGLIKEIETAIELDMIQVELLWRYLGLPV
jgi:hypothetical protein